MPIIAESERLGGRDDNNKWREQYVSKLEDLSEPALVQAIEINMFELSATFVGLRRKFTMTPTYCGLSLTFHSHQAYCKSLLNQGTQVGTRPPGYLEIEIRVWPYYHRLPFTSEGLKAAIEILKVPAEKSA